MSEKERFRLVILDRVRQKELSQVQAAKLLGISDRQVRYLLHALKAEGHRGIVSKQRGKPGNHRIAQERRNEILAILRGKLEGFGPTLAMEKLEELWGIVISKETLRQWMIKEKLWVPKVKRKKIHRLRPRRACFGELIQADGSQHRWFGPEREEATLIVLTDDATSTLTGLFFSETESLRAYYAAFQQHFERYGRPLGVYTDRSAIAEPRRGDAPTQFHRTLEALDIELIVANSPQAKGRIERANRTLQDRLLKEMRLRGICSIAEANAFLPEFMRIYNEKFSKVPMSTVDAHRPLEGYDLRVLLQVHRERTLSKTGTFQYGSCVYQVQGLAETRNHKGRKVDLCVAEDGSFRVFIQGVEHEYAVGRFPEPLRKPEIKSRKQVDGWTPRGTKLQGMHPWRRWSPGYLKSARR